MASVTGLTAARMLAIEAASVVDGVVDASGHLKLERYDGTTIDAGPVVGPQGNTGPTGSVIMFAGATAPSGWLLCNGAQVSRNTYADLFAVLGTAYGPGDGVTTFNLPDLRSRVGVGVGPDPEFDVRGKTGGSKTHTLTEAEMPTHNHTQNSHNHTQNSHNHNQNSHNHTQSSHTHAQNAHNHIPYWGQWFPEGEGTASNEITGALGGTGNALPQAATKWHFPTVTGSTTATNVATTAANVATTATNVATTATNNSTTAVNNPAGLSQAHNNLQPYLVLNHIIKV